MPEPAKPDVEIHVLLDVLGEEFNGVLGCDYFGAYRKYMRNFGVLVQFCLAHLIRDVKFLTTLPDKKQQAYGKRVREALRELFAVIHRRDKLSETGRRWCERIWTTIATCAQQGRSVFEFLLESVQAHLCGAPPPSLLPSGT